MKRRSARDVVAMLVPARNPGNQGYRYRCLYPARGLRSRGWRVRTVVPGEPCDAALLIVMSDVCLATSEQAEKALQCVHAARRQQTRIVVSETDNRFFNPFDDEGLARKASYVRQLYASADEIVVTTDALGEALRDAGVSAVPMTAIADPFETEKMLLPEGIFARARALRHLEPRRELARLAASLGHLARTGTTALVWFGGHGTARGAGGMLDLLEIRALLEEAHRTWPVSLTVISDHPGKFSENIAPWTIPTFYLPWNRLTFHRALWLHQVCVLPITPSPWTRCKSSNRLVTALGAGLATIAGDLPSYHPFASCCQLDNWQQGLELYLSQPDRRSVDVAAGRALIERDWTLDRVTDLWESLLDRHLPPR